MAFLTRARVRLGAVRSAVARAILREQSVLLFHREGERFAPRGGAPRQ